MSPVVAGVAGAVVGAGVGAAGAMVLSNEKSRKQVGKAVKTVQKKAIEYVDGLDTQKNMKDGSKIIKKMVKKAIAAAPLAKKTSSKKESSSKRATVAGHSSKAGRSTTGRVQAN